MEMEEKKSVLIVYAHQEPKSFTGALKDVAVEVLKGQGHNVKVSDLYELKFNPSASKDIFTDRKRKDVFDLQGELTHAAGSGTIPDEIRTEIDKILKADLIILQFPIYWLGMPAILKGWIDLCVVDKVAFDIAEQKWFDNGPFANKKIVLSFTTNGTKEFFSNSGIFGDMNVILWPIQNALRMTGIQILAPNICYAPRVVSENQRKCMLQTWERRLLTIFEEEPLRFVHVDNFSSKNGFQLSEEYLSKLEENDQSPTPGQNLGRGFLQNSMTEVPESSP